MTDNDKSEDTVPSDFDGNALLLMMHDLANKENDILYPMCSQVLLEADWARVHEAEDEIVYAFVQPGNVGDTCVHSLSM